MPGYSAVRRSNDVSKLILDPFISSQDTERAIIGQAKGTLHSSGICEISVTHTFIIFTYSPMAKCFDTFSKLFSSKTVTRYHTYKGL